MKQHRQHKATQKNIIVLPCKIRIEKTFRLLATQATQKTHFSKKVENEKNRYKYI